MPVEVFWDNDEKTIVHQIYQGVVIQEDYYMAIERVAELLRSVDHTVHSIHERDQVKIHPSTTISALRYGHRIMPPNLGINVIIGAKQFTRVVANLGRTVAPNLVKEIFFADNVEEARAIIARESTKQVKV